MEAMWCVRALALAALLGCWGASWGVGVQPDGKLVVGGYDFGGEPEPWSEARTARAVLVRHEADGALDASSGTNGIIVTDLSAPGDDVAIWTCSFSPIASS